MQICYFCFTCYLFGREASNRPGSNAFIEKGFKTWKKVNSGANCPLLNHVGNKPKSEHNICVQSFEALLSESQHIKQFIVRQWSEVIEKNQHRLKVRIDCVRWLTFQGCVFRGHNKDTISNNRGNFIELLRFLGNANPKVDIFILQNAPYYARYTSSDVQKEILKILANTVRNSIKKEI